MSKVTTIGLAFLVIAGVEGCAGKPPFVPSLNGSDIAPAAPKVAGLMANLKCELWNAANSEAPLSFYEDSPALIEHKDDAARRDESLVSPSRDRVFNLKNYFQEIEYVADAEFTLDVTDSGSLSPNLTYTYPWSAAQGKFPATSWALAVGGTFSDAGHRNVQLFSSIDFRRLVSTPQNPHFTGDPEPQLADRLASPCSNSYQASGVELGGDLGLKEVLAMGVTAAAMSDINLTPPVSDAALGAVVLPNASQYYFGVISAQIDFTVVEGINGGPTWNLKYFKGPGGGGSQGGGSQGGGSGSSGSSGGGGGGPLNFNRQVRDTLNITFVPVCIRQKYWPRTLDGGGAGGGPRHEYDPQMIVGTPYWANYLPSCGASTHQAAESAALGAARSTNLVNRGAAVITSP